MSYQSIPNYYGSSSNITNNQQGYAASEDGNQSHAYHAQMRGVHDGRQGQYAANSYGWSGPAQNTSTSSTQNTQNNASWQDRLNTSNSTSYNYQPDLYTPSHSTNSIGHAYQSRDTYNSQDTQGLNHLAYASGLDPSVSSNSAVRSSKVQSTGGYNSSNSVPGTHMRTASPSNPSVRYPTNTMQAPTQNSYRTQPDTQPSASNHNLALNAAAALAGAVRNRNAQSDRRNNTATPVGTSVSPINVSAQPIAQPINHSTGTTYQTSVPPRSNKKTATNPRPAANGPSSQRYKAPTSTTQQTPSASQKAVPQQAELPQKPREAVVPAVNTVVASVNTRQPPPPPVSNPQSIANLVSNDDEQDVYESVENQEAMPNFIDPTRVFNPYHREHERKKREAAEAEAKRKAEEQRLADEKRKAEEEASRRPPGSSTTANSKSKITKKTNVVTPSVDGHNASQVESSVASSAPNEDAMAIEMQKMMAKMKDFRSSNPALFQKLWNDMRGGGTAPAAPAATTSNNPAKHSPSPQVTQTSPPAIPESSISNSKARPKKANDGSIPNSAPANGYRVVVENNAEGLPDLGRFPAERRIRQSYGKNKSDVLFELRQQQPAIPAIANTAPGQPATTPSKPPEPSSPWPEPRRRAVAVAAIQVLRKVPENSAISISAEEICSLLERNPSYLDLCTSLEARGLKFQRTTFARDLLRSVPELQTPVARTAATEGQPVVATTLSHPASPSVISLNTLNATISQPLTSLHGTLREGNSNNWAAPIYTGLSASKIEPSTQQMQRNNKPSKSRPSTSSRPEPPPGSKEAAARKRDFAELIDLTELDNNDNYVMPSKQPRLEPGPSSNVLEQLDNGFKAGFKDSTSTPIKFDTQPPVHAQTSTIPAPLPTSYGRLGPQSALNGFQQRSEDVSSKPRMILAKKLDETEALQKSYYDPKTVARDILIASGRHPSERPLNLHLAGLIGGFIDLDSDVSTFDWDSIDPGGPPQPKVAHVDVPAAPPRFKLGERARRKRAKLIDTRETREPREDRRDEARPTSRTPAQAGSLATSPAPSQHKPSSAQHKLLRQRHGDFSNSQANGRKVSVDIPTHTSPQRSIRSVSNQTNKQKSAMEVDATPSTRRRGRPPGAKNKNPSVSVLKQQAKAVVIETTTPELPEELPQPVLHSYKCKWVKCHAELHNLDTLRRHVLKKHLPDQDEIKVGRLVCWWKKCRHLAPDVDGSMMPTKTFDNQQQWVDHIEEDHIHPIALKHGDGPKSSNTGKQVPVELDLSKFVYSTSTKPVTRTVSYVDPQSLEKARERWLSDHEGRSTTPLFNSDPNSDHPPDAMVLTKAYPQGPKNDREKADVTAQNAFMKAHGAKRQDTRKAAEEVVRAMEVRKEKIGPGLDRGGCTLINEARRSTFLQAPGISRVVDAEF